MVEHKHASVLRAIADGVPLSEFEYRHVSWKDGEWSANSLSALTNFMISEEHHDRYDFRRKPQYIMVNGFKVPKPLDVMPKDDCVYVSDICREEFYETIGVGSIWANRAKQRGIAHPTKEAAIAHAKAMLGIDPKWEE